MMDFALLRGWLKDGPQYKQRAPGWHVYAARPNQSSTEVLVIKKNDFDRAALERAAEIIDAERKDLCGGLVAEWIRERLNKEQG